MEVQHDALGIGASRTNPRPGNTRHVHGLDARSFGQLDRVSHDACDQHVEFVGLPAIASGQLLLSSMRTGGTYAAVVLPGMLVTSFGMGLVFLAVAVAAMGAVAKNEQGLASGVLVTAQQIGLSVGLAVLTTVAAASAAQTGGSLAAGFAVSSLVGATLVLATLLLVALRLPGAAPARPVANLEVSTVPQTPPCWLGAQVPVGTASGEDRP